MKRYRLVLSDEEAAQVFDGTKTQHRKKVEPIPPLWSVQFSPWEEGTTAYGKREWGVYREGYSSGYWGLKKVLKCPYGKVGDVLWIAETWNIVRHTQSYETGGDDCFFEWDESEYGHALKGINLDPRMNCGASCLCYRSEGEGNYPAEFDMEEIPWKRSSHMPSWARRSEVIVNKIWIERPRDTFEGDLEKQGVAVIQDIEGYMSNEWNWVVEFERIKGVVDDM